MKKFLAFSLALLLLLACLPVLAEDAPAVTTVQAWLDSKGEKTGLLAVQVQEVLNPVLALVADETGSVNLFGVTVDGEFTDFFTLGISAGDLLLLWNPAYNLFEGSIEMADSVLLRHVPFGK